MCYNLTIMTDNNNQSTGKYKLEDIKVGDLISVEDEPTNQDSFEMVKEIIIQKGKNDADYSRFQCTPHMIYPEEVKHIWRKLD